MSAVRRLVQRLVFLLVVFGAGAVVGYYVRDRGAHDQLRQAVSAARAEMQRVGEEAVERARRAAEDVRAGAAAAADSARAGVRELVDPSER